MTTRTRTMLAWTPAVLVSLFLILASAAPKLFMSYEGSSLQPFATALGLWDEIFYIGILELVCAVLILIPRTSTVGFVLMIGLLGGATATGLTHREVPEVMPWFPLIFIALITLTAYFTMPELLARLYGRKVPKNPLWLRIVGWTCATLVFLFNLMTAGFKFMPIEPGSDAEKMTQALGMTGLHHPLGVLQFLITILFIIPRTSTVGFVLLVGYWGGVLATNISHGFQTLPELMPIAIGFVLLTLSAVGRQPELTARLFKGKV